MRGCAGSFHSNIFVQFLAGPVEVRSGLMGNLLRLIAWISLVAGALALLVFFQLQFLPYHTEAVSWWQRIAVVADLALLWAFWPSVVRGERSSIRWRDFRRRGSASSARIASATTRAIGRRRDSPELKQSVLDQLPKGPRRDETLKRILILDPNMPLENKEARAAVWTRYFGSSASPDGLADSLAQALQTAGCAADGAPYVVHSWLETAVRRQSRRTGLSTALLDETHCAGARALSVEDKAKLTAMRDNVPR